MVLEHRMIEPFSEGQVASGVISYGLGSYGYDIRIADEFKIFSGTEGKIADPKNLDEKSFIAFKGETCVIPASSFVLGRSVEYFRIPRNVLALCFGKSTYARSGIIVNITPLEPEWEGHITIAVINATGVPARIYAYEGIAQVIFFESDQPPEISYADRKGKYQAQKGITPPKV